MRPLDDFKIRARINLTQFMRFNPRLRQRARPLLIQAAATMTVLLMALFVTGTVRAQSALPGDGFYTWKRASEQVWRAVSLDAVATDIILSNRRASEWIAVANDPLLNESAQAGYFEVLNRFLSENDIQAFGRLLPDLYKQHNMLNHAGLSTPELDHYLVVVIASAPIETVVQVIPTPSPTRVVPTATRIRPAPTATAVPTIFAPTVTPSAIPTATPTDVPTATATNIPTATPTKVPTATPTDVPTATPTVVPTSTPTNVPTATPTVVPTSTPTDLPTSTPTDVLTATPVNIPPANPP